MKIKLLLVIVITMPLLLCSKVQYHTALEKKGQIYYLKACSSCHGSGNRGGNLATMDGWQEYFEDDAKELIEVHLEDKASLSYLKSKKFKKEKKKMLKLLLEFASDSDFIPSCNN